MFEDLEPFSVTITVETQNSIVNVWNPFDQGFIKKTLFVRFMNNAYLAWMDEQKGNTNEV